MSKQVRAHPRQPKHKSKRRHPQPSKPNQGKLVLQEANILFLQEDRKLFLLEANKLFLQEDRKLFYRKLENSHYRTFYRKSGERAAK